MNFSILKRWVLARIDIPKRLRGIVVAYVLFVMVAVRKHSMEEGAIFWAVSKSQFSRLLKNHVDLAVNSMKKLSKRQAKQFAKAMKLLAKGRLPWKIAMIIDSTIQGRSTLHTENAKRFNHGNGFVIGHQWTNIVLIIDDMVIPLPPIPYYSKKYCRENNLEYRTENELVIEYINNLNLNDYIGRHKPSDIVVLADSGYDDKRIENAIVTKKWNFIIALNKKRSVKSQRQYASSPKSRRWTHVAVFFNNQRRIGWQTIRLVTNSSKRKRMIFRIRQTIGHLRYVGKVQLICSELKKRPDGRRKYLACNDLKAKARQIVIGYRLRWEIEIFHKMVKTYFGFQDVAAKSFKSIVSHVHWVYCAYILLHSHPPGVPEHLSSLADKQRRIKDVIDTKETASVIQLLTQIGGTKRYKTQLKRALQAI